MVNIVHYFPINAPIEKAYEEVSQPKGLDAWWTLSSSGEPKTGGVYELNFGPGYEWRAEVTRAEHPFAFELRMIDAHEDWLGTSVSFDLTAKDSMTFVLFQHLNWKEENEHYRTSCFCWAMYLRLMKRHIEFGEFVEYAKRLDA